jgi:hypothetical protein
MTHPSFAGEQRLLRLNTPAQGFEALPASVKGVAAGINWHNVLLYGGAAILIIGATRFAFRKLFGNG